VSEFEKRLDQIAEQTAILLEKQLEAREYCNDLFSEVISLVDQKVQETDEESDYYKNLERVHALISEQFSKFSDEVEGDINFLEEQTKALKQIRQMEDQKKAQEVLSSLLEEDEQLLETEEFKKNLEKEADLSKRNFVAIINDIKNSLEEGNLQDLELILSAMAVEGEEEESYQFSDEEEDFNEEESLFEGASKSGCGSCCSECPEGEEGCGIDIFSKIIEEEGSNKK